MSNSKSFTSLLLPSIDFLLGSLKFSSDESHIHMRRRKDYSTNLKALCASHTWVGSYIKKPGNTSVARLMPWLWLRYVPNIPFLHETSITQMKQVYPLFQQRILKQYPQKANVKLLKYRLLSEGWSFLHSRYSTPSVFFGIGSVGRLRKLFLKYLEYFVYNKKPLIARKMLAGGD